MCRNLTTKQPIFIKEVLRNEETLFLEERRSVEHEKKNTIPSQSCMLVDWPYTRRFWHGAFFFYNGFIHFINAMQLENIFGNIDTNDANFHDNLPFSFWIYSPGNATLGNPCSQLSERWGQFITLVPGQHIGKLICCHIRIIRQNSSRKSLAKKPHNNWNYCIILST